MTYAVPQLSIPTFLHHQSRSAAGGGCASRFHLLHFSVAPQLSGCVRSAPYPFEPGNEY